MADAVTCSLLVPCFNAGPHVLNFLNNISRLVRPFDEVLFYDDASTDNTVKILSDAGCKVIKGPINCGPGYARNRLAEAAAGDYIHFHDIDDELLPDYLSKTSSLANTGDHDVILCNADWVDAQTRALLINWHYSDEQIRLSPVSYVIAHPIGGINGLYKREVFLKAGGFSEDYRIWEDADMHVRLARHGARFCVLEEVLCISLRYGQSASADQAQAWLNRLQMLQQYAKDFKQEAVQRTIGREAQRVASFLVLGNDDTSAARAMQLSEQCGVPVPDSQNLIWHALKITVPKNIRIRLRIMQLKHAFGKGK